MLVQTTKSDRSVERPTAGYRAEHTDDYTPATNQLSPRAHQESKDRNCPLLPGGEPHDPRQLGHGARDEPRGAAETPLGRNCTVGRIVLRQLARVIPPRGR
jgi:hypothetical protein